MAKKTLLLLGIIFTLVTSQAVADVSEGWERHVIGDMISPIYLDVKDMDGDGDLDIASTTNLHPGLFDSEVAWFQNNLDQAGQWEKIIISSNAPEDFPVTNSNGIAISDIDGDGRVDVVVCTGRVTEITGDVYWFKAPEETDGEWKRFDIEVDAANSYFKIYTMDVNEDGMDDILVGGNQGAMAFINPGNPDQSGAVWEKIPFPEDFGETGSSLYLDDLNGDGKIDVLDTYTGAVNDDPGNISWFDMGYDSAGGEVMFGRTMIAAELVRAFDVNCMDVNKDSRKDIIVTIFQQPFVYWYEAPEDSAGEWTQHLISDTFEGTDIYTGDINQDGSENVIISGLFQGKISWFEYDVVQQSWSENLLDDDILFPGDITLNDLDGDGDIDVVLAGMGVGQMIWYENMLKGEGEKECQVLSISPGSVNTGFGILPRFKTITITLSGVDLPEINRDDVDFDAGNGITVLNISAGGDKIEMLVMFWGADKGTYNVNVGSCGSIPFIVE